MGEYQEYIRAPHGHRDQYTVPDRHLSDGWQCSCDWNRDLRAYACFGAFCAHHADVHPADWRDRAPGGAAKPRPDGLTCFDLHAVARYERCQMRFHADRSHARATAAVRNAEVFMCGLDAKRRANKAR